MGVSRDTAICAKTILDHGSETDIAACAKYLSAYAGEMAWREDRRRMGNGEQYLMMAAAAAAHPVSRQWKGYWQKHL